MGMKTKGQRLNALLTPAQRERKAQLLMRERAMRKATGHGG